MESMESRKEDKGRKCKRRGGEGEGEVKVKAKTFKKRKNTHHQQLVALNSGKCGV